MNLKLKFLKVTNFEDKNMIKSLTTVFSLLMIVYFSIKIQEYKQLNKFIIPGYDGEVAPKERDFYFSRLLADPQTGEIPIESILASKKFVSQNFINNKKKNKLGLLSDYDWNIRGPYQIGGRVRALSFDIRNENHILAAGCSGGLWLSENGGDTWRKVTNPSDNHSVSCIVQDTRPGKENTWYYGTGERIASKFRYGYGMYKSTDNGLTWKVLNGTVNGNVRGTWDNSFDFIFRIVVDPTAPIDEDVIIASTALGGIHRSADGGESFINVLGSNFGNNSAAYSELAVTSDGVFYATMSRFTNSGEYNAPMHGIYRSINGIDWERINDDRFTENYSRIVIGINPSNENEVYFFALTQNEGKQTFNHAGDEMWHSLHKYTYLSDDGKGDGGDWIDLSENLPKLELNRMQTNSQGGYNMVIAVHPTDPNTIILGDINLWRSNDAFTTNDNYEIIGGTCREPDNECNYNYRYPNHHSDVHEVIFSRTDPIVMYTGTDGGVHKTIDVFADYVEWISLNNGFYSTQFYNIGIVTGLTGNYDVIGGMQDNGTFFTNITEAGHHWSEVLRGDGFNCEVANDGSFVISSRNSTPQPKIRIYKSSLNESGNVIASRRIDPIGGRDFSWNTTFALDPNSNDYLYLAGGGILWRQSRLTEIELTDEGDSISFGWDSLTHTFVDNYNWNEPRRGEIISAVSVSKNPANVVYYGTTQGRVYRINDANIGDPTPELLNANGLPLGGNVGCIAINPDNADDIIVVFSTYNTRSLFHSSDGGNSWEDISGSLEEYADGSGGGPAVQWADIMPMGNGEYIYFAGTSDGLFVTSLLNGRFTPWQIEASETIGTAWVSTVRTRAADNYVAIGTYSQGVFDAFVTQKPEIPSPPTILETYYTDALDTLTIFWEPGQNAIFYKIEISDSPDFSNIIQELYSKSTSHRLIQLEQGFKNYYARISSLNGGGLSEPSQIMNIQTFLGITSPVFPPNESQDIPYETIISWQIVENADSYHFQLNPLNVFNNPMIDTIVTQNSLLVALNSNRNYRWRVRAIKNETEGLFSSAFSFRTGTQGSVRQAINSDFSYYPNPAVDFINLELKNNKFVSYSITDINGKIISKNKISKQINVSTLKNGIYFLILENNNEKIYKKFVVSK